MQVFKALSSESRIKILEKILQDNQCCKELDKCMNLDFSTISRHLKILEKAELVSTTKKGKYLIIKPKNKELVKKLLELAKKIEVK